MRPTVALSPHPKTSLVYLPYQNHSTRHYVKNMSTLVYTCHDVSSSKGRSGGLCGVGEINGKIHGFSRFYILSAIASICGSTLANLSFYIGCMLAFVSIRRV